MSFREWVRVRFVKDKLDFGIGWVLGGVIGVTMSATLGWSPWWWAALWWAVGGTTAIVVPEWWRYRRVRKQVRA